MKKLIKLLAVVACGWLAASAAQAQTATTTFQVTANVQAACSVAATDLVFGNYLASSAGPTDSTSTVTVTCSNGTTYGVDVGATPTNRLMARAGGGNLNYGMFNEAGRTTAFGVAGAVGNGGGQNYTVFGRIPPGQFVIAGAYAATVDVTVTY